MLKTSVVSSLVLALFATSPMRAQAPAARSASVVLDEIKALADPAFDTDKAKADPAYRPAYLAARAEKMAKRAPLILELYTLAPETPELAKLLPERWQALSQAHQGNALVAEVTAFLAAHPDSAIKTNAATTRALVQLDQLSKDAAGRQAAIAEFEKVSPKDKRLPSLLKRAFDQAGDMAEKQIYLARLQKDYPAERSTTLAAGELKAHDSIGKPFDLAFTDVVSGKKMSIADLKGKVVVLDFWATWCGPCVAEMPNMKAFYAKYKDKGLEIIGVSLDYAGAENVAKIKDFVAKNDIAWPQYYQGNGWDSAFSAGMGVAAIPCVFLIDADGKLVSIDARGHLEELVPGLLKARDAAAQTGDGSKVEKKVIN